MGVAVHAALEFAAVRHHESGEWPSLEAVQRVFKEEYSKSINTLAQDTPNFDVWFGSGPYPGAVDIERRFGVGLDQTKRLFGFLKTSGALPAVTSVGGAMVEQRFDVVFGGVPVVGFIDRVNRTDAGFEVQDIKTGAKPGGKLQLVVYSAALEQQFGLEVSRGSFLMGKTGKPSRPVEITAGDRERVHSLFADFEADVQAGRFPATPGDQCRVCDVATSCKFKQ